MSFPFVSDYKYHLSPTQVRERIRLNGRVISRDLFSHYFNEIWDMFERCEIADLENSPARFPSFLKYIVVMSYYVFIKERVDVAVIEVGLGGRYDCTNVVDHPALTAITHLGYDHCSILGYTIEEIANEKAGIMKEGVPVLTVNQHYTASYPVLEREAREMSTAVIRVPPLSHYPNPPTLNSDTWSDNISLSLQIAKHWLNLNPLITR
ncbi:folylpolyglutamate synthase, mitochondrial-like [Bolinopsis microptera]|uniref:folylpolyglutamate synthase, mitochondrial-like n=1 Tax=Bolinopsis microptera TaxID=2820187 RepID=UPI00307AAA5F